MKITLLVPSENVGVLYLKFRSHAFGLQLNIICELSSWSENCCRPGLTFAGSCWLCGDRGTGDLDLASRTGSTGRRAG